MKVFLVRSWRTFRWWNVLIAFLFVWVFTSVGYALLHGGIRHAFEMVSTLLAPLIILALAGLVIVTIAPRRYRRSERTKPYDEILGPLVTSAEEYCLLLRPFGSDGEIILPYGYRPWWMPGQLGWTVTLEQVVASAARKSLGLKVCALVDQDRLLAPPGPVYLRSPHDHWQSVTRTLIRRAHSIVIILAPGQEIRTSFQWEIEQITQHDLQKRVIIVLPPWRRHEYAYHNALQQACALLATFEGFAGSVGDVDLLRAYHWERQFTTKPAHIIKLCRGINDSLPEVEWWYPAGRRSVEAKFYRTYLTRAFAITERELSGLNFSARYPWRLVSGLPRWTGTAPSWSTADTADGHSQRGQPRRRPPPNPRWR